jgi:lipoprotein-releasing system ATP-binding protein
MIKAKNINFSYDNIQVLKDINLEIKEGEFISIVGSSGAGKTTLLNLLGTLQKVQKGSIIINNQDINKLTADQLSKLRNKYIGFIFQFHNLLAEFTVLENVCLPALTDGKNKKNIKDKAKEILESLNMSNKLNQKPNELSGGEQQRVAVARSLINSPSILLADEPSGNLDSKNAEDLHNILLKLNKEKKQTIIVITHNNDLAKLADRVIKIEDGKII